MGLLVSRYLQCAANTALGLRLCITTHDKQFTAEPPELGFENVLPAGLISLESFLHNRKSSVGLTSHEVAFRQQGPRIIASQLATDFDKSRYRVTYPDRASM